MVHTYIILALLTMAYFCQKLYPEEKKKTIIVIPLTFTEQFDFQSLIDYWPFIILLINLLVFISLSSTLIWKNTGKKYDLQNTLTRVLNQIIVLIIIMNCVLLENFATSGITNESKLVHILICLFFVIFLLISWEYFGYHKSGISIEFPILFFFSYISMYLFVSTSEIFVWFFALEIMSFSLYTLAGYRSKRFFLQTEGSLKYFIIGSIASSLFIFGLSLIYMNFGTVDFDSLISLYYFSTINQESLAYLGLLFIMIAISFKLGIAPFHIWLPEVYYSVTSIVTFFFLLVPKIPLVYLFSQFCKFNFGFQYSGYFFFIFFMTFFMGTLGGLRQRSIDKFLAYSSIANNSWFILFLANPNIYSNSFLWFYLFVSNVITVLIYAPIMNLRKSDNTRLINNLRDLICLKKTNPTLAIVYSMAFFSLAGIPPFLGFFSKFFILLTAIDLGMFSWVIVAIIFSVFSCYYYIRMIKIMYFSNHLEFSYHKPLKLHTALTISILTVFNLFFIFFPKTFMLIIYFIS